MSTLISSLCWKMLLKPSTKSVLISLADQANDDGWCWPSVASLVMRTCLSERAIQGALKELEQLGAVQRIPRRRATTMYRVTPDAFTGVVMETRHYVYRLTHTPSGRFYIGVHSTWEDFLGSDCWGPPRVMKALGGEVTHMERTVVGEFSKRPEALAAEAALLKAHAGDPLCLSRMPTTTGGSAGGAGQFNPADAAGLVLTSQISSSTPQELHPSWGAAPAPKSSLIHQYEPRGRARAGKGPARPPAAETPPPAPVSQADREQVRAALRAARATLTGADRVDA